MLRSRSCSPAMAQNLKSVLPEHLSESSKPVFSFPTAAVGHSVPTGLLQLRTSNFAIHNIDRVGYDWVSGLSAPHRNPVQLVALK